MKLRHSWLSLGVFAAVALAPRIDAQSAISTDGVIESKSGGFKFPDGSIQTTAAGSADPCPTLDLNDEMIWVGGVCIDKYEASVWDAPVGGNLITGAIPCNVNGQDCTNIYARSVAGVQPRTTISWFQAQAALANSGKRLPWNNEWQMAAMGTPDPGDSPGAEDCTTNSAMPDATGARTNCVSLWGAHDMVGNVWEWVADWVPNATACPGWGSFSDDSMCVSGASTTADGPGALLRGGGWNNGSGAGPFAVLVVVLPSGPFSGIGFRGAR